MASSKARYKVWRASKNAEAGFMVTPESAFMIGSADVFIATTSAGNAISGPLSIMAPGQQVRRAGLFVEQNEFLKMIPSTIVTPIPQVMPFPPIAIFAQIAKAIPYALALLAG